MKLPTRFRAAIFDFDETMIDLEQQHNDASAILCRELGDDYERMPRAGAAAPAAASSTT